MNNFIYLYRVINVSFNFKKIGDMEEDRIFEMLDAEGNAVRFELFDIVEFEESSYAILQMVDEAESGELTVMKVFEAEDGDSIFESIEDDAEFERVVAYLESLDAEE